MSFSYELFNAIRDLPDKDAISVLQSTASICEDAVNELTGRERSHIAELYERYNMPGFAQMLKRHSSSQISMVVRPQEVLPAGDAEQMEIIQRILGNIRASKGIRDSVEMETSGYLSPHRTVANIGRAVDGDYVLMFQGLELLSPERRRRILVDYFDQRTFNTHAVDGYFGKWLQDPEFFKDFIRAGKGYLLFFKNETFMNFVLTFTPLEFNDDIARVFVENNDVVTIARNIKHFAGLSRVVFQKILEAGLTTSEFEAVYENTQAFKESEIDQATIRQLLGPKLQKIIKL